MNTLSEIDLATIYGGGDSFGKDAGQFIGGAVGAATNTSTGIVSVFSPTIAVAIVFFEGIKAALQ